MTKKTLYILRHAKAETGSANQEDRDRELAPRGIEAARIMGQFMAARGIRPDKVLCSTSARTRQTWALAQQTYGEKLPVEFTDKLYLASVDQLLDVMAATPDEIGKLLIIGHNPDLHQLAFKLARTGDEQLLRLLAMKFPTGAFAAIGLDNTAWHDVAKAHGRLEMFASPKILTGEE